MEAEQRQGHATESLVRTLPLARRRLSPLNIVTESRIRAASALYVLD